MSEPEVNVLATMPDYEQEKRLAAAGCLDLVKDGMTVGLGTGSTASYFLDMLSEQVRRGLDVRGVPTSLRTEALAKRLGIPLTDFSELNGLDLTVDGADEIDPRLNLIKGGGGALLREKIVASVTDQLIIIGDSRKRVGVLGHFPLPVEVIPFGWQITARRITVLGAEVNLRFSESGQPFLTAENNFILDCNFGTIRHPAELAESLTRITGVVEHGLFVNMAKMVIIGRESTTEILRRD